MRTERTGFAIYSESAATARFRVEKSNAAKRLDREERRKANAASRNSTPRATVSLSRFETHSQGADAGFYPVAGFIAQILGQMLSSETPAAASVAYAYAHTSTPQRRTRSFKYA